LVEQKELDRGEFVRAVLERNPSIEASRQSFRAVLAEVTRESSLDDPRLSYSFAPLTIVSDDAPFGQTIALSQKLPWPGKRALAGEVAVAEAEAVREDYRSMRLRLSLIASLSFDQYYAVERSIERNEEHRVLLEDIRRVAEAQYETGRGSQQEPLQAAIELARVEQQDILLRSRRAIVVAQMNGLLHRAPEAPLPRPPKELDVPDLETVDAERLRAEAFRQRPELHAQTSRVKGLETARELAEREYYPDFEVMASYSSMWMNAEHQWMLGVALDLPLQFGARDAKVEAVDARIAQAEAELRSAHDEIAVEVESARQRFLEGQRVVALYRGRLLPLARAQIEVARAAYVTGAGGFQALIDAERSLRTVELDYQQALATLGERRAEVVRTLGRIPGIEPRGGTP
jgi:outer membrane protein TolC